MSAQTAPFRRRLASLIASRREGFSLPQPFYADPDVFELDLQRVHRRLWSFAGHLSEIPNPGDYRLHRLGRESVIVIRGQQGEVHAHHNVCTHRGSVICTEPRGSARKLVCPYHQWTFHLDGRLAGARHAGVGFDRTPYGLRPVHVQVVQGLIFLCFADEPAPFDLIRRDLSISLERYDLASAKVAHRLEDHVEANWKLIAENARECYHCPGGHAEYCQVMLSAGVLDPSEQQRRHLESIVQQRQDLWQRLGLHVSTSGGLPRHCHWCARSVLREGYITQSLDGKPLAPLLGTLADYCLGTLHATVLPTCWIEISSDHAVIVTYTPVTPTRTRLEIRWLVRGDAVEGRDYQVERLTGVWRTTAYQDKRLCEQNQDGVMMPAYRPGPYVAVEDCVEQFVQWYLRQITLGNSEGLESLTSQTPEIQETPHEDFV